MFARTDADRKVLISGQAVILNHKEEWVKNQMMLYLDRFQFEALRQKIEMKLATAEFAKLAGPQAQKDKKRTFAQLMQEIQREDDNLSVPTNLTHEKSDSDQEDHEPVPPGTDERRARLLRRQRRAIEREGPMALDFDDATE
jgi:hypothetical protein